VRNEQLPIQVEEIREGLKEVIDPEIGLNIVDLGMVKDINVNGKDVTITIALTVSACPLAKTIEKDVNRIIGAKSGVESVHIKMTSMSKQELEALGTQLQEMRRKEKGVGKAPGLSAGIDKLDRKGLQKIIAVMSGKGGVGKSYVTSMLAIELQKEGYNVGILDADITGPSIAKIFGLSGKPYADETGVVPKETENGIKIISMNLLLDTPETPVIWRGPIINGVIRQLFNDVNWGDLHYLLIDLPPGTGDAPLTVFQSLPVDAVVIVSTPQDLAMLIVKKSINMARQMSIPIAGLVENMSYLLCPDCGKKIDLFQQSGVEKFAAESSISFLGKLPFDPKINRLADKGQLERYSSEETALLARKIREEVARMSGVTATPIAWKASSKKS
jgi:Mrp family chromosome partitioning ATPase